METKNKPLPKNSNRRKAINRLKEELKKEKEDE